MKKIPSFKILGESLNELSQCKNEIFYNILKKSITNENELNEVSKQNLDDFLNEAYNDGWYPFVSYAMQGRNTFDELNNIKKDNYIFNLLMLEKELGVLKEFNEDVDLDSYKKKIRLFKAEL